MATYLEVVNAVLNRMREGTVSTIDETEQSALIGEFVNDAKNEVESATKWSILRETVQVTTLTDGTYAYTLTGAGIRHRVLQVRNATEDYDLMRPPSYAYMNNQYQSSSTNASGMPIYWDYNGMSGGDRIINIFPYEWDVPQILNFNMYRPQDRLVSPGTEIIVDESMIILRAHMLAVEERGDDQGTSLEVLNQRYDRALDQAIAVDQDTYPDESIWSVE